MYTGHLNWLAWSDMRTPLHIFESLQLESLYGGDLLYVGRQELSTPLFIWGQWNLKGRMTSSCHTSNKQHSQSEPRIKPSWCFAGSFSLTHSGFQAVQQKSSPGHPGEMALWDTVLCWEGPKTLRFKAPVTFKFEHKNKTSTFLPPGNPKNCQQSLSFLNWLMSSGTGGVRLKGTSYLYWRNEVKLALIGGEKKERKKQRGGEKEWNWNLFVTTAKLITETSSV